MLRFFRNVLLTFVSLAILGMLWLSYELYFSPYARAGRQNSQNSYRVHPGMSVVQARRIMGPATRRLQVNSGQLVYEYHYMPGASEEIYLRVTPDSTVERISHGE